MNGTDNRRIGKYEIIEELGRGGFSMVYKAHDTELGRIVALRVLYPHLAVDLEFIQRFYREAQAMQTLQHPNIAPVYEIIHIDPYYCLAMEYIEGQSLEQRLAGGTLPMIAIVAILRQLAAALDEAHAHGMVHRDVKPGNIMVKNNGEVKLLDFGIVRAAEGTRLTRTIATVGTPEYMAPEQANGHDTDRRTDIYSLGIVAYEMCVGRVPFIAPTPLVVLRFHAEKDPPAPRTLNPNIPVELEPVLLKALAKDPNARYQQAGEFAAAFMEAVKAANHAQRMRARKEMLLQELQVVLTAKDWESAAVTCERILKIEPKDQRIQQVLRLAQATQERNRRLQDLYAQMETQFAHENWEPAIQLCDDIIKLDPDYRDTAILQQEVVEFLQHQREKQQQEAHIAELYVCCQEKYAQKDWNALHRVGTELIAIAPYLHDVDEMLHKAEIGLKRQTTVKAFAKCLIPLRRILAVPYDPLLVCAFTLLGSLLIPVILRIALTSILIRRAAELIHIYPDYLGLAIFFVPTIILVGIYAALLGAWSTSQGKWKGIRVGIATGAVIGASVYALMGVPYAETLGFHSVLLQITTPSEKSIQDLLFYASIEYLLWSFALWWGLLLGCSLGGGLVTLLVTSLSGSKHVFETGNSAISQGSLLMFTLLSKCWLFISTIGSFLFWVFVETGVSVMAGIAGFAQTALILIISILIVLLWGKIQTIINASEANYMAGKFLSLGAMIILMTAVSVLLGMGPLYVIFGMVVIPLGILVIMKGIRYQSLAKILKGDSMPLPTFSEALIFGSLGGTTLFSFLQVYFDYTFRTYSILSFDSKSIAAATVLGLIEQMHSTQLYLTFWGWVITVVVFTILLLLHLPGPWVRERNRRRMQERFGQTTLSQLQDLVKRSRL